MEVRLEVPEDGLLQLQDCESGKMYVFLHERGADSLRLCTGNSMLNIRGYTVQSGGRSSAHYRPATAEDLACLLPGATLVPRTLADVPPFEVWEDDIEYAVWRDDNEENEGLGAVLSAEPGGPIFERSESPEDIEVVRKLADRITLTW